MVDFLQDLFAFLKSNKKFWMLPVFVILILLGAIFILAQSSVVAPFIYTLF